MNSARPARFCSTLVLKNFNTKVLSTKVLCTKVLCTKVLQNGGLLHQCLELFARQNHGRHFPRSTCLYKLDILGPKVTYLSTSTAGAAYLAARPIRSPTSTTTDWRHVCLRGAQVEGCSLCVGVEELCVSITLAGKLPVLLLRTAVRNTSPAPPTADPQIPKPSIQKLKALESVVDSLCQVDIAAWNCGSALMRATLPKPYPKSSLQNPWGWPRRKWVGI